MAKSGYPGYGPSCGMGSSSSMLSQPTPTTRTSKYSPPLDQIDLLLDMLKKYQANPATLTDEDVTALRVFLRTHDKEAHTLSQERPFLTQELFALQNQRKDILNKVSEIAGARLKSNNPAIADLSDQNRPSKLAEKFSELYDNEWTDATEELKGRIQSKDKSEDELDIIIIKYLYNFTKEVYEYCKSKSQDQLKAVKKAVRLDISEVMIVELERKCRELIRANSEVTLCHVMKEFKLPRLVVASDLKIGEEELNNCQNFQKFFKTCIRLCWMMNLQDPPVYMITCNDSVQMYRAYTRSGDVIDYVVWPSLLLHKGGPLLYKGVAQLKKTSPQIKKETDDLNKMVEKESKDENKPEAPSEPVYDNFNPGDSHKSKDNEESSLKENGKNTNAGPKHKSVINVVKTPVKNEDV